MTGAAIFAAVVVTVLVLGTYLVQAAILAIRIACVLAVAAGYVAFTLVCALIWLGECIVRPREALAALRAGIARAEAESAIRRLNGVQAAHR